MLADLENLPADLDATFFDFLTTFDENLKKSMNSQNIHMGLMAIKKNLPFWAIFGHSMTI